MVANAQHQIQNLANLHTENSNKRKYQEVTAQDKPPLQNTTGNYLKQ